jgi:hypothetical protein
MFESDKGSIVKDVTKFYKTNKGKKFQYDLLRNNCQHFVSRFRNLTIESPDVICNFYFHLLFDS